MLQSFSFFSFFVLSFYLFLSLCFRPYLGVCRCACSEQIPKSEVSSCSKIVFLHESFYRSWCTHIHTHKHTQKFVYFMLSKHVLSWYFALFRYVIYSNDIFFHSILFFYGISSFHLVIWTACFFLKNVHKATPDYEPINSWKTLSFSVVVMVYDPSFLPNPIGAVFHITSRSRNYRLFHLNRSIVMSHFEEVLPTLHQHASCTDFNMQPFHIFLLHIRMCDGKKKIHFVK